MPIQDIVGRRNSCELHLRREGRYESAPLSCSTLLPIPGSTALPTPGLIPPDESGFISRLAPVVAEAAAVPLFNSVRAAVCWPTIRTCGNRDINTRGRQFRASRRCIPCTVGSWRSLCHSSSLFNGQMAGCSLCVRSHRLFPDNSSSAASVAGLVAFGFHDQGGCAGINRHGNPNNALAFADRAFVRYSHCSPQRVAALGRTGVVKRMYLEPHGNPRSFVRRELQLFV